MQAATWLTGAQVSPCYHMATHSSWLSIPSQLGSFVPERDGFIDWPDPSQGMVWALELWGLATRMSCEPSSVEQAPGGIWRVVWRDGLKLAIIERGRDGFAILLFESADPDVAWCEIKNITHGYDGIAEAVARVRDYIGERRMTDGQNIFARASKA